MTRRVAPAGARASSCCRASTSGSCRAMPRDAVRDAPRREPGLRARRPGVLRRAVGAASRATTTRWSRRSRRISTASRRSCRRSSARSSSSARGSLQHRARDSVPRRDQRSGRARARRSAAPTATSSSTACSTSSRPTCARPRSPRRTRTRRIGARARAGDANRRRVNEFALIARYLRRAPRDVVRAPGRSATMPRCSRRRPAASSPSPSTCWSEGRHFLRRRGSRVARPQDARGESVRSGGDGRDAALGAARRRAARRRRRAGSPRSRAACSRSPTRFGVALVGGDTTRGPRNLCVTIIGEVPAGTAITRSGAQAGDDV